MLSGNVGGLDAQQANPRESAVPLNGIVAAVLAHDGCEYAGNARRSCQWRWIAVQHPQPSLAQLSVVAMLLEAGQHGIEQAWGRPVPRSVVRGHERNPEQRPIAEPLLHGVRNDVGGTRLEGGHSESPRRALCQRSQALLRVVTQRMRHAVPQLRNDASRSVLSEHLLCKELCHGVFVWRSASEMPVDQWRPKRRIELAMLCAPKRKSLKAVAKRPCELDDDPWMDKATPVVDPTPVPLT